MLNKGESHLQHLSSLFHQFTYKLIYRALKPGQCLCTESLPSCCAKRLRRDIHGSSTAPVRTAPYLNHPAASRALPR